MPLRMQTRLPRQHRLPQHWPEQLQQQARQVRLTSRQQKCQQSIRTGLEKVGQTRRSIPGPICDTQGQRALHGIAAAAQPFGFWDPAALPPAGHGMQLMQDCLNRQSTRRAHTRQQGLDSRAAILGDRCCSCSGDSLGCWASRAAIDQTVCDGGRPSLGSGASSCRQNGQPQSSGYYVKHNISHKALVNTVC